MASRSLRNRLGESTNIWPGFVDVLATLLIVIIFVLMIFTVSQIYLSDAISGRDKALQELRIQISELSKILQSEVSEKQAALNTLAETESLLSGVQSDLKEQELIAEGLQTDLAKKSTEIFVQEQNIIALSGQITELLSELRIVAKALEVYEGLETAVLDTEGLGEKINKALAARIDQLKTLNEKLDQTNKKLSISQTNLNEKISELNTTNENLNKLNNQLDETNKKLEISENDLNQTINELNIKNENLMKINKSLGLEEGGIAEQLQAKKNKNQELLDLNKDLLISQKETQETLKLLEQTNLELSLRDEELQNQITQYQNLMNDLLEINDSLGLKDATLQEQLEAADSGSYDIKWLVDKGFVVPGVKNIDDFQKISKVSTIQMKNYIREIVNNNRDLEKKRVFLENIHTIKGKEFGVTFNRDKERRLTDYQAECVKRWVNYTDKDYKECLDLFEGLEECLSVMRVYFGYQLRSQESFKLCSFLTKDKGVK